MFRVVRDLLCVCLLVTSGLCDASERRDPTRPPTQTAKAAVQAGGSAQPVISSIIAGPTRQLAVIDGQLRRVGDRVGSMTVTAIEPEAVELQSARSGRVVLRLSKRTMKKEYR